MYILFKTELRGGISVYNPVKKSENLEDLSEDIKKRVRDGCPFHSLHIAKEVPFDILCGVKYKEGSNEN